MVVGESVPGRPRIKRCVLTTLVSFIALERELGNLLGQKVDLVERETLKPVIGQRVLAEVIPV